MYLWVILCMLSTAHYAAARALSINQTSLQITPPVGFQLALAENTTETSNLSIDTSLPTEKGVEALFVANTISTGAKCTLSLRNPTSIIGEGTAMVMQVATVSAADNLVEFSALNPNPEAAGPVAFMGSMTFSEERKSVIFNPAQIPCSQQLALRITPQLSTGKNASVTWTQNDEQNSGLSLTAA